ncbi:MAG: hypothetical protein CL472_01255 [Acidobacteria bacterium]|nr:hypothetical protein [Acidobacteriota bacterium]
MTDPKTAARTVAARLSDKQITIKHVQALDLVAAGCGYQDRSKLSALAQLPALKKVNIKLLTSAATILAKHDLDRRQTIVDTTAQVLIPTSENQSVGTPRDLPRLNATVRSDDFRVSAEFDAAYTFERYTLEELQALANVNWGGDIEADDIAYDNEASEPSVAEVLNYARLLKTGFECYVDPDDATAWLIQNRPEIARQLVDAHGEPLIATSLTDDRIAAAERWYADYDFGRWSVEASSGWSSDTSFSEVTNRIYLRRPGQQDDTLAGYFIVRFADKTASVTEVVARIDDIGDIGQALDPDKFHIQSEGKTFSFSRNDLIAPYEFLESDEGQRFIKHIADTTWSAWSSSSSIDQSTCNEIANDLIGAAKARARGEENVANSDTIIARHFNADSPEDSWFDYSRDRWGSIEREIEEILENLDEQISFDQDEWEEALREECDAYLIKNDTSKASDMISKHNTAEVMFWLISPDSSEDDLIEIDANYPDPTCVRITDEFQFALAKLGWTTSKWRDYTKSKMASHLSGTRPAYGTGHSFPGSNSGSEGPLISLEKLVEIIENGCTNYFGIVLYGIVPLQDLIDLDLSRPIAFERAHIAVYNAYAGTFMDTTGPEGRVVVQHGVDGKLNGNLGASPAEFCGLVTSYYETRLTDPVFDDHKRAAIKAFDDDLAAVPFIPNDDDNKGMKRRYPGHSTYWEYADDTRKTLVSKYGIGVTNRYDRDYRVVDAIYDIETGAITVSEQKPKA